MANINGTPGNDILIGTDGNDNINGQAGADQMTGKLGNDIYTIDNAGDTVIELLGEGTDLIRSTVSIGALFANVENATLTGTLNLNLTGNNLFNILTGNSGANVLDGGGGGEADSMSGGAGNDTYIVDNAGDLLKDTSGVDLVNSSVSFALANGLENLTGTGVADIFLTGNSVANTIIANDGGNALSGLGGNDILIGGTGNDNLNGGTGNDNMAGGDGNDQYTVDAAGDIVTENPGEGDDTVNSSVTFTLGANLENLNLTGNANINGTGNAENNEITGNTGNNILSGKGGNDILNGADGTDQLFGGDGDDYYFVSGTDTVTENVGEGTDTVETSSHFTLGNDIENLLTGINASDNVLNLVGNSLGNTITNNNGGGAQLFGLGGNDTLINNTATGILLDGGADDDVLTGGAGNDNLVGGTGADAMSGGDGDDTYDVDDAGDVVTENLGEGIDRINSSVTHTMEANVENMTLTGNSAINGTGNELGNEITGNSGINLILGEDGNDFIDGQGGADIMLGGKGDDTFIADSAGDTVIENAAEGYDRVITLVNYTLGAELEQLDLAGGAGPINGTGNSGDNFIFGNQSANVIDGGGSTGGDYMNGSGGDDTFHVRNLLDIVDESLNDGLDTAHYYVDFGLAALYNNVDNLFLADGTIINAVGNALNNTITANGQDNLIDGMGGNDIMIGGAGNDTYAVDTAADFIIDSSGTDVISSTASGFNMALNAANVENGRIENAAGVASLTGNSLVNELDGNTSDNILDGGAGADLLDGGAGGNDTFIVDVGVSEIVAGQTGADTVQSGAVNIDISARADLSHIVLTGALNLNATGNAGNNSITGNAGNNVIDGGAGADNMQGGGGDDTYTVDNTGDVTSENANEGSDTVNATVSHTIGNNIENLNLLADGLTGTGNGSNNTITGFSLGASTLNGLGGDDNLIGGTGNDVLDGGAGADFMVGFNGNNTFFVDQAGGLGVGDYADNNGGNAAGSVVNSTISWDLSDGNASVNINNLNLIGNGNNLVAMGTGGANALNNNTTGANTVTLNGGMGADTMVNNNATLGATTVFIVDNGGDTVTGAANATDNIQSSVTFAMGADQDNLTLTGGNAINGTGNALGNTITGNSNDNVLNGGLGPDILIGLGGNDYYVIDQVGETVTEAAGGGNDTVELNGASGGFTYTLASEVENGIIAAGPDSSFTLNGNSLNNTLTNLNTSSIVTLNGGLGSDTLIGANVNETFVVDNVGDSVTGGGGAGDIILASTSWDLTVNTTGVNHLTLVAGAPLAVNALGNANANNLTGNENANQIDGRGGADNMAGGGGDDTYFVDDAGDIVTEAASNEGHDTVNSSITYTLGIFVEDLVLTGITNINGTGNDRNNSITGNSGNNIIDGGANGGIGFDRLTGGSGDDYYNSRNFTDIITEVVGEGTDTIEFFHFQHTTAGYTLAANVEHGILNATALDQDLTGNALSNNLTGNASDNVLNGLGGTDVMVGGGGNDTFIVDDIGDSVTGGAGNDTVQTSVTYTLGAALENLTGTGAGNINLTGNALSNVIIGNSGNNIIDGMAGGDIMTGNAGNDTYNVDDAGDAVNENAGEGTDTQVFQVAGTWTLAANVEIGTAAAGIAGINITGNGLGNTLNGNALDNILNGGAGVDIMNGGGGDDTFHVDDFNDVVTGNTGLDTVIATASYNLAVNSANTENLIAGAGIGAGSTLTGNSSNNTVDGTLGSSLTLDGGAGDDTLIGNGSNENFVVDSLNDVVQGNGGTDTIHSSITYDLSAVNAGGAINLILTGAANINGTGDGNGNFLQGNSGNNVLDGGAGSDIMQGGLGNDSYFVDDAGDTVIENAGGGNDSVSSTVDFDMNFDGDNVENLFLLGTAINATGNSLSNNITGNGENNVIDGGAGADAMTGGDGDDTYTVDNASDQIFENAGEGTDLVNASASHTLGANVDNLTLVAGAGAINGTGNADSNTITGNEFANVLNGMGGADNLIGGDGNDTYVTDQPGDIMTENAGEGTDTVVAGYSFVLQTDFENLSLSGTGDFSATGNDAGNIIIGNSGNNLIDGGLGLDDLRGGAGDDTYNVDTGDDVTELAGEGNDTVNTLNSFTLGVNIENLVTAAGAAAGITLTGNALSNVIDNTNGLGGDVLDGGAGADTLIGSANDDTFVVDNAGDALTSNGGNDIVNSSVTYDLGVSAPTLNTLNLTGAGNINGTGTGGNDFLTGNAGINQLFGLGGNDQLDGMGGADLMNGGDGDDTFFVDNAGDQVVEGAGGASGEDTVNTSVSFTLGNNVENGVWVGGLGGTITGNALDNQLEAGGKHKGVVTLNGGAGSDTLINSGFGSVVFVVDNAGDSVQGSAPGFDTVQSSVSFDMGVQGDLNVDDLVLTGKLAINGTGNANFNNITGNAAANTLNDGGGGDDILNGLGGNDTYIVNSAGTTVNDTSGIDTVQTSVSFDLSVNGTTVENLLAFGGSDITLTGNALKNTITGDAGGDALNGLGGNDILLGGVSNDILDGGTGKDTMNGGGGNDTYHFSAAVANANADIINGGFDTGAGGDVLDVSDILVGYNGNVTEYVQITQSGANTIVKVDVNGLAGPGGFITLVTLNGVNLGTDEAALVATNNLVVT